MDRSAPSRVGWYGLRDTGDGWRAVTPDGAASTLLLPTAISYGATHIGHWSGDDWEHVEAIALT